MVPLLTARALLGHADSQLAEAFGVGSQTARGEVVAEEGYEVVADLPCDATRKLSRQIVRQPGSLDAEVAALELGDVWLQSRAGAYETTEVDWKDKVTSSREKSQPVLAKYD